MPITKWDRRWLKIAETYSSFSKDPSTKVGAVIVRDDRPLSQGWNGVPRGLEDTHERLHDREVKYAVTVHAEMNAVLNAAYEGSSLKGSTLYVYGLPVCSDCAKAVIQSGVERVVMLAPSPVPEKWLSSFLDNGAKWFDEAGIEYVLTTTPSGRDESGESPGDDT